MKTRTKITLEFVVEHGEFTQGRMLGSFNLLDFIEAGFRAPNMPKIVEIEPGAKLRLSLLGSHRSLDSKTNESRKP